MVKIGLFLFIFGGQQIFGIGVPSDTASLFKNKVFTKISSHRGNSLKAPENTLATFQYALELGTHFIEIDVRTSKDGELVLLHDGTLNRTTTGLGPVNQLTLAEIKQLRANKGYEVLFPNEKIPTVQEAAELISNWNKSRKQKTYLYVDCKQVNPTPLISILKKYNLAQQSVFYGSDEYLSQLKNEFPTANVLPALRSREEINSKIQTLHPYGFDANWLLLNKEIVDEIHSKGIYVFSDLLGPFDQTQNYLKANKIGLDVIQTDKIRLVQKTLLSP